MNNFKKPNYKKRSKSVDGFVTNRTTKAPIRSNISAKFQKGYEKPAELAGSLDAAANPRRIEGFHARSRSDIETNEEHSSHLEDIQQVHVDLKETQSEERMSRRERRRANKYGRGTIKKAARTLAVLAVAGFIGAASLFAYGYIKANGIFKGNGGGAAALQEGVDPGRLNGEGDGRVNILLIGRGGAGQIAPDLTDTLLLASIDPVQNEASLISVPRDLYVQGSNDYGTKINTIYANAKQARLANGNDTDADKEAAEVIGLNALKRSVTEVLGIPVHYYVLVDFDSFERAIDTVGGITVDVQEPLYDQSVAWLLGGNPLVAAEGLQTFDGERALLYARSRKGSARGDFDRTARQREIIVALQQKVLSLGTFSNPFKIIELLDVLGDGVRTDLNGIDEVRRLYEIGQKIGSDKIGSVGLADPPNILVTTDTIGAQSVVVPSAGLYQYEEIHSYIRNNVRDAFLANEDARIVILNGTTIAGFATARSAELRSYGYNITSVDNAPTSSYVQSLLIDNTNGAMQYTENYLERRMQLTATSPGDATLPGIDEADFVIILGTDEAD